MPVDMPACSSNLCAHAYARVPLGPRGACWMGGPSGSELGMFGQGVLSLGYPKHDLEGGMQAPVGHILLALWTPLCRKGLSRAGPEWAL